MKKVSIVGFGRFGKVLYRLLRDDFAVTLYNRNPITDELASNTKVAKDIKEIYENENIFFAVPIASFEEVIISHRKYFRDHHVLIDVLSVKEYPATVFRKHLRNLGTQAMLTHPMFGPDSSKNGFKDLPIIMNQFTSDNEHYFFWKKFFASKELSVIELSPQDHDKLASNSQGVTHFIGRLLKEIDFKPTAIDSLGSKKLLEVVDQTCNDTWELFINLQNYNKYTKSMRLRLGKAYDKLYNKLLPKRIDPKKIMYGIQGGIGSFNEEAVLSYVSANNIKDFSIKYLFTTENVLKNLHEGNIDFGQFAIQNAVGGVVQESTYAMARYKFHIVDEFAILIKHCLMKRKDIDIAGIRNIMAHPQNFRQCKDTLAKKYGSFTLLSGDGNLVDTAKAAQALSEKKIPEHTAILGPKNLARLYNLEIIEEDLQDNKENFTTFFVVGR